MLQWLEIAARLAVDHPFGALASSELEAELLALARELPLPPASEPTGRARWLHVFTRVYETGGHTAMAARWLACDHARVHSVVLLDQAAAPPDFFVAAVHHAGGQLWRFEPGQPLLDRACALRTLAWAQADVVVLHVHPWDVVPTAAFGVPGGPPVLVVNHAGHAFWPGGAVTDLVLNLRAATQEWTEGLRGIPRVAVLPILVPDGCVVPAVAEARAAAKARLALPPDALTLLTVGQVDKYRALPDGGLDFLGAAASILRAEPRAWLLAVGPTGDDWDAARQATHGRVRAEGPLRNLADYHAAADLFLESFPFGSSTALLEAAIRGIPCVRAPRSLLPPLGTGGAGIEVLPQPEDETAYVREAVALLGNESARRKVGALVAASVRATHGTTAWLARLEQVVSRVPARHGVYPPPSGAAMPAETALRWAAWASAVRPGSALVAAFEAAVARGLEARADCRLLCGLALGRLRSDRGHVHDAHRWASYLLPADRWIGRTARRLRRLHARG